MFGRDTQEPMPQAFLTDPDAWDRFVGGVWHAAMDGCALPADGTAVEIGPGASAKIGHALARRGFRGTLYVVDGNAQALAALAEKYQALLPQARLHIVHAALDDAVDALPGDADALLASHILDDFILGKAPAGKDASDWAAAYSPAISAGTARAWAHFRDAPERLAAAQDSVAQDIAAHIGKLRPRHVLLNQYPSATLRDNGMDALNAAALGALREIGRLLENGGVASDEALQERLSSLPHYGNDHIGRHVLDAAHWVSRACRT
jgi:hypothetical protein